MKRNKPSQTKWLAYFGVRKWIELFSVSAVSVSVGVWTLVAISLERYFAICRPLKSRRWQTQFHAYKMIVVVWLASLIWNSPILIVSRLQATKATGKVVLRSYRRLLVCSLHFSLDRKARNKNITETEYGIPPLTVYKSVHNPASLISTI
jgi:hypothetical protein